MSKSWLDFLERLLVILLAGFAFWPNGVSTTSLILLVAIRLFRERSFPRSSLRFILLLTPLFLILLSWVLFGFHPKGLSEIRLLPLMLGCAVYFYSAKTFDLFKQSFIGWSVLQAAFILIFFTTIDLDPNLSLSQQIRDLIGESFNLHPTFLSVAWSWALLIALTNERLKPVSKAVIAIVLVLALALAGGKMPLLALVATGFLLLLAIPTIRLWKKLALGLSIGMVLTALVFSPFIGKRFAELKDIKTQFSEGDLLSSTDLRVGVWRCAIQSIGDHIWTGVGVGNSRQTLETCYSSYHQIEFFDGEYNTHNQWMHFWFDGWCAFDFTFHPILYRHYSYCGQKTANRATRFFGLLWIDLFDRELFLSSIRNAFLVFILVRNSVRKAIGITSLDKTPRFYPNKQPK